MQSREIFDNICKAARDKDEVALDAALKQGAIDIKVMINNISMTPVAQLASENNQEATQFLLNLGASKVEAIRGYAKGGHVAPVELLLDSFEAEKSREHREAKMLALKAALEAYAIGGHTEQVEKILEGAPGDFALVAFRGYVLGKHPEAAKTIWERRHLFQTIDNILDAIFFHAMAGNSAEVQTLYERVIQQWPTEEREAKISALTGYTDTGQSELATPLLKELLASAKNDREKQRLKNNVVMAYAWSGLIDQIEVQLKDGAHIDHAACGAARSGLVYLVDALVKRGANQALANQHYKMGGHTGVLNPVKPSEEKRDRPSQEELDELFKKIFDKLGELEKYGNTLNEQARNGNNAIELAQNIRNEIEAFRNKSKDAKAVSDNLNQLFDLGRIGMGEDRKALDIIAHIALACTGIGLFILLGKKLATGSFFLNPTKRQTLLDDINETAKHLIKPKG